MRRHHGHVEAFPLEDVRARGPQHGDADLTRRRSGARTGGAPGPEQQVEPGDENRMHMIHYGHRRRLLIGCAQVSAGVGDLLELHVHLAPPGARLVAVDLSGLTAHHDGVATEAR